MLKQKYVYFFPMNDKIVWSFETLENLRARTANATNSDKVAVERLIAANTVGNFISLESGEIILQQN